MDNILGSIIEDPALYNIIENMIVILSLVIIYLGIQIALTWKYLQNEEKNVGGIISQKGSFIRSTVFIFIAGFFMVIHKYLEIFVTNTPDYVTFELFELIAFSGVVMFLYEWHNILKKLKTGRKEKKEVEDTLLRTGF